MKAIWETCRHVIGQAAEVEINEATGPAMREPVQLENIEQMRRRAGIDDTELRKQISQLAVGDLVRLTLLSGTGPNAGETLPVRITSIQGSVLRGELVARPASAGLGTVRIGFPVAFTTAHIHSIPSRLPDRDEWLAPRKARRRRSDHPARTAPGAKEVP